MDSNGELALDPICSACQQIFQATDGMVDMDEVEDQSFEAFCNAVSQGCFLCSYVWNMPYKPHPNLYESLSENSWRRPTFELTDGEQHGKPYTRLEIDTMKHCNAFHMFPLRGILIIKF